MTGIYDDETLMAFADGVLEEPLFSEVAAALEVDAALAARLDALVLGKDLARAVYRPLAQIPVPHQLRRNVTAAIARAEGGTSRSERRSPLRAWAPMAIAAAFACLVAGPIGYLAGRGGFESAPSMPLAGAMEPALAELAANLPSGEQALLGDGTRVMPVASFKDAADRLCREFELRNGQAVLVIACRPAEGWRVELAVTLPSADEGYRPASAPAVVDSYLAGIGAGAPLSLDEEEEALAGIR